MTGTYGQFLKDAIDRHVDLKRDVNVLETGGLVSVTRGEVQLFSDTVEHQTAVCELMGLDFCDWTAFVAQSLSNLDDARSRDSMAATESALKAAYEASVAGASPVGVVREPLTDLRCRVCGGGAHEVEVAKQFGQVAKDLVKCRQCGLVSLYPEPTTSEVMALYTQDYYTGDNTLAGYRSYADDRRWREDKARQQIAELRPPLRQHLGRDDGIAVLDLGSGFGYFRKAAEEAGWRHDGVECSEFAVAETKRIYGYETGTPNLAAALESGYVSPAGFDLVTMWDVLEHFEDPASELGLIHRVLGEEGMIALRTPNIDCVEYAVFGGHYHSIKLDHLFYLSADSLTRLLEICGFKVLELATNTHILQGLISGEEQDELGKRGRGADLFCLAQKVRRV